MFLPKSWVGSISTPSAGTPAATIRAAAAVVSAITAATTSAYATRCGLVRGAAPPVCEQTMPAPNRAATWAKPGIGAGPGVVDQVGAGLAGRHRHR